MANENKNQRLGIKAEIVAVAARIQDEAGFVLDDTSIATDVLVAALRKLASDLEESSK